MDALLWLSAGTNQKTLASMRGQEKRIETK